MILFVEGVSLFQIVAAEDGLKAQKLLAQGIALGIVKVSKAPCFTLIEQALSVFFNVNYI